MRLWSSDADKHLKWRDIEQMEYCCVSISLLFCYVTPNGKGVYL